MVVVNLEISYKAGKEQLWKGRLGKANLLDHKGFSRHISEKYFQQFRRWKLTSLKFCLPFRKSSFTYTYPVWGPLSQDHCPIQYFSFFGNIPHCAHPHSEGVPVGELLHEKMCSIFRCTYLKLFLKFLLWEYLYSQ